MDSRCRFELFGGFRVLQGDQIHTRFRTHKAASLLSYLALYLQQTHPRERLLDLFWPEMDMEAGRDNLSTVLSALRRQLEPVGVPAGSVLVADRQQVRLNAEVVSTDVADFDRLIAQARRSEDALQQTELFQQAVALYRGELLPGCEEEWAVREQARCQSVYLESLRRLARLLEESGRNAEALEIALRETAADPYEEEAYQAQMRLLVCLKRPAEALQTYEKAVQLFRRELGAMPSAATRQMAETIQHDPGAIVPLRSEALAKPPASAPTPATPAVAAPPASPAASAAPLLPMQLTRFFGREREREQITRLLHAPETRLITLLGPGGAGKTRLSIEVAEQVALAFENRVWFVQLADIPDASLIALSLVNALRLPPAAKADPLDRVIAYLAESPCLLVLDNMEHLLREPPGAGKNDNPTMSGSIALVRLLLQRAPGLKCLVTSRQALRLGGEHEFPLPALALPSPADSMSPEALLQNESIALYVDRARTARPDFALTPQNAATIATLCRRLEGMPLAIEMAAAWVKTIPPQKMLERLERQLDLLVSRRRDLPPRHQSLRATIEWSYDLLSPELRAVFAHLSVFRGGWTLEAAEAVCGVEALNALMALQEQSLILALETEAETRYRMLEPLREFGQEKLAEAGEKTQAQQLHAAHFVALVQEAAQHYTGPEEKHWLNRIEVEMDNVRAALAWMAESPENVEQRLQCVFSLVRFWTVRGYFTEGRRHLQAALEGAKGQEETLAYANVLMGDGNLAWYQGDYETARIRFEASLELKERLNDAAGAAMLYNNLANAAIMQEDFLHARALLEEGLRRNRRLNLHNNIAAVLGTLGSVVEKLGEPETAQAFYLESLTLWREIGNRHAIAIQLNNLGTLARKRGDCEAALAYARESLQIRQIQEDRQGIVWSLVALAALATLQGQAERAIILYAAAALRAQMGMALNSTERQEHADNEARLREMLPATVWETAQKQGQMLTQQQATAFALEEAQPNA